MVDFWLSARVPVVFEVGPEYIIAQPPSFGSSRGSQINGGLMEIRSQLVILEKQKENFKPSKDIDQPISIPKKIQKSGLVGQSSYKTFNFGFENSSKLSRSMQDDLLLLKSWRLKNTFGNFWDPMQSFAKAQFGASEFAGWRFWPKVSQLEFFSMKKSCDVDCPAVNVESGRKFPGRSSYLNRKPISYMKASTNPWKVHCHFGARVANDTAKTWKGTLSHQNHPNLSFWRKHDPYRTAKGGPSLVYVGLCKGSSSARKVPEVSSQDIKTWQENTAMMEKRGWNCPLRLTLKVTFSQEAGRSFSLETLLKHVKTYLDLRFVGPCHIRKNEPQILFSPSLSNRNIYKIHLHSGYPRTVPLLLHMAWINRRT